MKNVIDIAEAYWKWKKEIDKAPEAKAWSKLIDDCGRLLEFFGKCDADEVSSIHILKTLNKIKVTVRPITGGEDYYFINFTNNIKIIDTLISLAISLKEAIAYEKKKVAVCEIIINDMKKKIGAYKILLEPCPPEFTSNLINARAKRNRKNKKIKELKFKFDSIVTS